MARRVAFLLALIAAVVLGAGLSASAADGAQPKATARSDTSPVVMAGRVPLPVIEPARGDKCVDEPAAMRRNHPKMLSHQRDETVFRGERQAATSLKACIDCHASTQTGSVAASAQNFCQSCHVYAAVKLDCFECHSSKPSGATALAAATPATTVTTPSPPARKP